MFDTLPIEILYLSANVRYEKFSSCSRVNWAFSERLSACRVAIVRGNVNIALLLFYRHNEFVTAYWSWLLLLFFTDEELSLDE